MVNMKQGLNFTNTLDKVKYYVLRYWVSLSFLLPFKYFGNKIRNLIIKSPTNIIIIFIHITKLIHNIYTFNINYI